MDQVTLRPTALQHLKQVAVTRLETDQILLRLIAAPAQDEDFWLEEFLAAASRERAVMDAFAARFPNHAPGPTFTID